MDSLGLWSQKETHSPGDEETMFRFLNHMSVEHVVNVTGRSGLVNDRLGSSEKTGIHICERRVS